MGEASGREQGSVREGGRGGEIEQEKNFFFFDLEQKANASFLSLFP
jgi:hypothetical protein